MSHQHFYATCAVCGKSILHGDVSVSVCRSVDQVEADGDVTVKESATLACLCGICGDRFPQSAIRVNFGADTDVSQAAPSDQSKRGAWFSRGITSTGGGRQILKIDTAIEVVQPDYEAWQAVRIGMEREEVVAVLGRPQEDSPIGPPEVYWTYGHLQFPLMPRRYTYVFLLGFDHREGRVFIKSDPFGGIFSPDGKPTKPTILAPPPGRCNVSALPAGGRSALAARFRRVPDPL